MLISATNYRRGGAAMDKKGFSLTTILIVAIFTTLIVAGAAYFTLQQYYLRDNAKLTLEVTGLEAQVTELQKELQQAQVQPPPVATRELRSVIQEKGDRVLLALKNKEAAELAKYVHPQLGLRFTPYTFIHTATDQVFPVSGIPALFGSNTSYTWGSFDGSGDPINLTFSGYYAKFIYDQNFLAAPQIVFNQDWESLKLVFEQSGNTWYLVGIIHEQWTI
jgi:flagellar basal body-associated protein FliL